MRSPRPDPSVRSVVGLLAPCLRAFYCSTISMAVFAEPMIWTNMSRTAPCTLRMVNIRYNLPWLYGKYKKMRPFRSALENSTDWMELAKYRECCPIHRSLRPHESKPGSDTMPTSAPQAQLRAVALPPHPPGLGIVPGPNPHNYCPFYSSNSTVISTRH